MDVRMPDGTTIKNVPDGTTRAQLLSKLRSNGHDTSAWDGSAKPGLKGGTGSDVADGANAVGTGGMRGLARLAGLPVDTMANVLDLGKAAIGTPYVAITGKPAPSWLEPTPRAEIFGSGENLINLARKAGAGSMVDPVNPEYEGGYLQAAGGAAAGILNPNSKRELAGQLSQNLIGATAGKAVGDATGDPALAITAGLSPLGAQAAAAGVAKRAIRGDEAGRQNMVNRTATLQAAGVDNPTLGLASGNKFIGGVENLLQSTPGAVGVMGRNRDAALAGLEGKVGEAADLASTNRGAMEAGSAIQSGIKNSFRGRVRKTQTDLYGRLGAQVSPDTPASVANTSGTLKNLTDVDPAAPNVSARFVNRKIGDIKGAFDQDSASFVQPGEQGPPAGPPRLPFGSLLKLRSQVGEELSNQSLVPDVPTAQWKRLYGSMSDDVRAAAQASGEPATRAFNRANDYTRASIARTERVAPIVERPSPEQTFKALSASLKENTSTLQAVKKSLPQDARGDFAGTVIERLGKAKPGQQDETGTKWSPETFLTNWSSMSLQGRRELLSGFKNSDDVRDTIDAVAKATAMMRDSSRMWANPSGTAANVAARSTLGAVGVGGAASVTGLLNPWIPVGAAAGIGATNLIGRAVTNNGVRDAAMRRTSIDPRAVGGVARSLIGAGQFDPEDQ